MLLTISITYPLWQADRLFPLVPLFSFIPTFPAPVDTLLFVGQIILLLAIIIIPRLRLFSWLYVVLFVILAIEDQNRLQPFFYQYVFTLFFIGLYDSYKEQGRHFILNSLRILLIGTYVWAGLQKLNTYFIDGVFPYLLEAFITVPVHWDQSLIKFIALIIPFTEIAIGVGFMLNKYKKWAVLLALVTHMIALLILGPWGHAYGQQVWPWNVVMIILCFLLFWTDGQVSYHTLIAASRSWGIRIALLFFGFMPILNFFGYWDHYLSFSLYSGKAPYAAIYVDDTLENQLPHHILQYIYEHEGKRYISVTEWASGEIRQMPCPEERVYEKIKDHICTYSVADTCTAKLIVYPYIRE